MEGARLNAPPKRPILFDHDVVAANAYVIFLCQAFASHPYIRFPIPSIRYAWRKCADRALHVVDRRVGRSRE